MKTLANILLIAAAGVIWIFFLVRLFQSRMADEARWRQHRRNRAASRAATTREGEQSHHTHNEP